MSRIDVKTSIFLILSDLAADASWIYYFKALKLVPASQVAPIDKRSLVLVSIAT
ncbi:hypothetical protein [Brucella grignonensis]|uniref:Uncharacterized protein n=1 Tax=Brucella grignonensis TaxID=94627 RepID=A0A256FSQ3_9HYPH|nr:hypothetical protein [Brucella grignonensis]NKB84033.1 hypothetical protein [Brucella grignonensis]OYR17461.1 hypothetical protein CEV33_3918 [Brucella grignonensis]